MYNCSTFFSSLSFQEKKDQKLSLSESIARTRTWDRSEAVWKANARRLAEMVAMDMEPYSLVEPPGFKHFVNGLQPKFEVPGRHWLTDTAIPELYDDIRRQIKADLTEAQWISFTTDIWTANYTNVSFMSLPAHWISPAFERKMAVLHIQEFSESHSAENIASRLRAMLSEWDANAKVF